MKIDIFLWTKIFIKIKTRDKIRCSQKISWEGGGAIVQFTWEKINPGKCLPGNLFPILPPKKKRKKKKTGDHTVGRRELAGLS